MMWMSFCEWFSTIFFGGVLCMMGFVALVIILSPIFAFFEFDKDQQNLKGVLFCIAATIGLALFTFFGSGAYQLR